MREAIKDFFTIIGVLLVLTMISQLIDLVFIGEFVESKANTMLIAILTAFIYNFIRE